LIIIKANKSCFPSVILKIVFFVVALVSILIMACSESNEVVSTGDDNNITPPKSNYSTTEWATGDSWIDVRMVYKKVIILESLPNAGQLYYPHNISNMDYVISLYGATNSANNNNTFPLPNASRGGSIQNNLEIYRNGDNIRVRTDGNFGTWSGKNLSYFLNIEMQSCEFLKICAITVKLYSAANSTINSAVIAVLDPDSFSPFPE